MGNSEKIRPSLTRPRIGVVVVDDGLYTHRWLASLVQEQSLCVVFVVCLSPFYAKNFNPHGATGLWRVSWLRTRYYGLFASARFALKSLNGQLQDWLFGMGIGHTPHSVRSLSRAHAIPLLTPAGHDINEPAFCTRLAAYQPDLLVCAFSQRAEAVFLEVPRLGCLHLHFSELPQHRGREPLFHAMLAENGAGVSLHWMVPRFDAGSIVWQESLDLASCRTLHQAILAACEMVARMLPLALHRAMEWQGDKQFSGLLPPAHHWPTREEIQTFHKKKLRFF
jgi:folate-dependent phosphoribosylglycinamide formyltransferase PurN